MADRQLSFVRVSVMDIGIVRVAMHYARVDVQMGMRLAHRIVWTMRVLMVDVVNVPVLMP